MTNPTFEWSAYPDATSYRLAVYSLDESAYVVLDTVATSYCDSAECTYPLPASLSNGDYKFKVLAYIPSGATDYSDWMEFTITGVSVAPLTPLSPILP